MPCSKKPREQPAQDHRVGDVGDVELIEAKQRCGPGDRSATTGTTIAFVLLSRSRDELVHLDHEFMEMDAALRLERYEVEEQVHQHRLAAADRPEQVKPARDFAAPTGEKEKTSVLAGGV